MEEIRVGQVIELEDTHSVCICFMGQPSIVVNKKTLGNVKAGDFIVCGVQEKNSKVSVRKLHIFRQNQVGDVVFKYGRPVIRFCYQKGQMLELACRYFPDLYEGAKVRFRIENDGKEFKAIIYQILKLQDNIDIDILEVAEDYGIPTVFSKKAMKQAKYLKEPSRTIMEPERKDYSKETIFTIDGLYSKDFDDAVSLKQDGTDYLLGVHIADVGYYIVEGSPLDLEARKRGMTAYLLNCVYPMFPNCISNGICSLKEDVDRYTLSVEIRISNTGEIKDVCCFPALIHSKKRMTYEDVNAMFCGERVTGYHAFSDILYEMSFLAQKLYQNRVVSGAIPFDMPEPNMHLDAYGHVLDITERNRGKAEFLIQEFMLLANQSVASLLYQNGIFFPHRIHGLPEMWKLQSAQQKLEKIGISIAPLLEAKEEEKAFVFNKILNQYRGRADYGIICSILVGTMRKAKYSLEDTGHFGLGLERYTHFTSPIRRYPDLMVHRLIRKHCFNRVRQSEPECEALSFLLEEINRCEVRINRCTDQIINRKCQEYLLANVGKTLDAIVKDCTDKGILVELKGCIEQLIPRVELNGLQYEGSKGRYTYINQNICYQLGSPIKVKLVQHIPGKISFEIKNENSHRSYCLKKSDLY